MPRRISDQDYAVLAEFRFEIRKFHHFSEERAADAGLTAQQHQALLALRATGRPMSVGDLADRLLLKPHSVSGLIDRLAALGLCERLEAKDDRRRVLVRLTRKAAGVLDKLTEAHREELLRLRPLLSGLLGSLEG